MKAIKSSFIHFDIKELLSSATSEKNINKEYRLYIQSPVRRLYGYELNGNIIGIIGIIFLESKSCEIKHIAVASNYRGQGIGSKMVCFIKNKYSLSFISAETDKDALKFYENYGFKIISLGEKYPGVERFYCTLKVN